MQPMKEMPWLANEEEELGSSRSPPASGPSELERDLNNKIAESLLRISRKKERICDRKRRRLDMLHCSLDPALGL